MRYQAIEGWGGLIANFHWVDGATGPHVPYPPNILNEMLDDLVFDLGINRVGIGAPQLVAHDNEQAYREHLEKTEPYVREILIPLQQRAQSQGERFIVYLIAGFYDPPPGPLRRIIDDPEAYAEFALASIEYMRKHYVKVDYWVVQNEPDFGKPWTPAKLGRFIAYLGGRMHHAGFSTTIVAPETVHPKNVSPWLAGIAGTPHARRYLGAISYHSYDHDPTVGERPPVAPRAAVANWGRLLNLPVVQTEQGQAGKKNARTRWNGLHYEHTLDIAENILADLLYANASAWQLHAIIGRGRLPSRGVGGVFIVPGDGESGIEKPPQYWALRHFSHWLRPGAVRVALSGPRGGSPVVAAAFLTPAGRPVVVAMNRTGHAQELRVNGLPAGSYRISLTTREQRAAEHSLPALAPGDPLRFTLPPESLATFFTD